jgi:hypothetical protein
MKKLMLVVAVAISTAVSAQKAPRKVIIETTGYQVLRSGVNIIDSAWVEYTRCEKDLSQVLGQILQMTKIIDFIGLITLSIIMIHLKPLT